MIVDPRRYSSEELLRDGGSIHIRALRPDDGYTPTSSI
jgi:hypothetical protein